ncbi:mitochondrial ATP synthase [Nadsonia fulvescens var. elongata DSM 6958]|uniref:ATP synthase subunit d, mitochondrial n=1 Tax=Nadsonia fulvescens var. elongata DSM 6958 TaxID=857566 RepID=A0A1E3PF87_9ASCO|nr:mitochondrial ATP synthase [Nadsonia fulvescens var. elongata DSM 6958]
MSAVSRSAVSKIDWVKITSTLGLAGSTVASLTAFRKRNDEAKKTIYELKNQSTDVDFAKYRSVLKNQDIVAEIESAFNSFKPVTYDVAKQIKTIEAFEAKAVENAQLTESKVADELAELQKAVDLVKDAKPFEQLTLDELDTASDVVHKKTVERVSQHKWNVPGYEETFGNKVLL